MISDIFIGLIELYI